MQETVLPSLPASETDTGEIDTLADNAVLESSDAFGRQVGTERTGLYDSNGVRGFNPVDAGNVRVESLYYDQVDRVSPRLTESTTIRVGLSTLGYAFPAPTGLVDYALRKPRDETSFTFDIGARPEGHEGINFDLRVPNVLGPFGFYAGGAYRNRQRQDGGEADLANLSLIVSGQPSSESEITLLASRNLTRDDEPNPTIFTAGDFLPPEIERKRDLTQPWADGRSDGLLLGAIGRVPLRNFRLEGALFYSRKDEQQRFADLLLGVLPGGDVTNRVIIADGNIVDQSLSGEVRLLRDFTLAGQRHQVSASIRGREREALFGGSRRIDLGPSTILEPDVRGHPEYTLGQKNTDNISQMSYGLAYAGNLADWFQVDVGASQVKYRKDIDFADPAATDISVRTSPVAWNAALSLTPASGVTIYASLTRGLEEADVAPDRAINRAEAPAAIRTRQEEFVLRVEPVAGWTLLAGAFRITKPYYNLDDRLRYRLLGTVRNQGLEFSLVANPVAGLTLLGGAVLSDPEVSGETVDAGLIGSSPIGQADARAIANIDWRPDHGASPLSLDLALEHRGRRAVNSANSLFLTPETTMDLGFRYRFETAGIAMVLRGRLENVLDDYGWNVSPSGGLTYSQARTAYLQLTAAL
nr:TonB-dependent receptor [Aurantiacibacter sp. 219JJ12-13]MDP5262398.1 TonB-dependent receptor [Aurantiacibacter sp. 219JJ12-13]